MMQLRLGQLIKKLEECDPEQGVIFDFCRLAPSSLHSYRGYYTDLAISWTQDYRPKIKDFLKRLRDVVGFTFEGYKGGEFTMNEATRVWVANYGESTDTAVVDVRDLGWAVMIITEPQERR